MPPAMKAWSIIFVWMNLYFIVLANEQKKAHARVCDCGNLSMSCTKITEIVVDSCAKINGVAVDAHTHIISNPDSLAYYIEFITKIIS